MNKKTNIEELFKNALKGHEMPYNASEWSRMESLLDKKLPVSNTGNFIKWFAAASILIGIITGAVLVTNYFNKKPVNELSNNQNNLEKNTNSEIPKVNPSPIVHENIPEQKKSIDETSPISNKEEKIYDPSFISSQELDIKENPLKSDPSFDQVSNIKENYSKIENENDDIKINKKEREYKNESINIDPSDDIKTIQISPFKGQLCMGEDFSAAILNTHDYDNIEWTINDRLISTDPSISFSPHHQGVYEINITASRSDKKTTESISFEVRNNFKPTIEWKQENPAFPNIMLSYEKDIIAEAKWFINGELVENSNTNTYEHAFNKSGPHHVKLEVNYANGCSSFDEKEIHIIEDFSLLAPTAFNPSSNIVENKTFIPRALETMNKDFVMTIYDRNGQIVYQTQFLHQPWDGTYFNSGKQASEASYVWTVRFRGESQTYQGVVSLLR